LNLAARSGDKQSGKLTVAARKAAKLIMAVSQKSSQEAFLWETCEQRSVSGEAAAKKPSSIEIENGAFPGGHLLWDDCARLISPRISELDFIMYLIHSGVVQRRRAELPDEIS
jgi:uracil-DNA glycosylase